MNRTNFKFNILATSGNARIGKLQTPRGEIDTPAFMPVGTQATVKAMLPESVSATGAQVLLGNAYHLMLRPTAERIERLGGLHRFMNWHKPILTDSGGFQVMSMQNLRKTTDEGVEFRSHIDGARHFVTPERSIAIQRMLGADISMCFDECISFPIDKNSANVAMHRSMEWAQRCKVAFGVRKGYALFGIQQGSTFEDLRMESSNILKQLDFDGYAIGGLAVGEPQNIMFEALDYAADMLPVNKPRYLMGVGTPSDIMGAVSRGVDMFDCVLPSRSGRTGQVFYSKGKFNIKNSRFSDDTDPLCMECSCPACSNYSRAYLHHAFKSNEIICSMLLTWHNQHYYQSLMQGIRSAIKKNNLQSFINDYFTKSSGN